MRRINRLINMNSDLQTKKPLRHRALVFRTAMVKQRLLLLITSAFFLSCFAWWLWGYFGPDAWRPRVICSSANPLDFGTKHSGDKVDVAIILRNTGLQEAHIDSPRRRWRQGDGRGAGLLFVG